MVSLSVLVFQESNVCIVNVSSLVHFMIVYTALLSFHFSVELTFDANAWCVFIDSTL